MLKKNITCCLFDFNLLPLFMDRGILIKNCKECPWVVKSNNNKIVVNHSKRHNKKHNCHMSKGLKLWDDNPTCQCYGNKKYLENGEF